MSQILSNRVDAIGLREIDPEDRTFAISPPWWPVDLLVESVRRAGILSPLHIQKQGRNKKRIVCGFRRYEAARQLGLSTVPCLIPVDEINSAALFQRALLDNVAARPLHALEKATALLKLSSQFDIDQKKLIEEFLPLLGVRSDRFHLQYYLDLGRLTDRLQRSVADSLEPEVALKLSNWKPEEQTFFLNPLREYQPGRNRQKELLALLDELQATQEEGADSRIPGRDLETDSKPESPNSRLAAIWERSGAASIAREQHLPPAERLKEILSRLHSLDTPILPSTNVVTKS